MGKWAYEVRHITRNFAFTWYEENRMLIYEVLRRVSIYFVFLSLRSDSTVQILFPSFFVKLFFLLLKKEKLAQFGFVLFFLLSPCHNPRLQACRLENAINHFPLFLYS